MIKNILIVKGGKYAEAEVSRKTAINVEKALKAKGYNTTTIEPQDNLISYINDNKKILILYLMLYMDLGVRMAKFKVYLNIFQFHTLILA